MIYDYRGINSKYGIDLYLAFWETTRKDGPVHQQLIFYFFIDYKLLARTVILYCIPMVLLELQSKTGIKTLDS